MLAQVLRENLCSGYIYENLRERKCTGSGKCKGAIPAFLNVSPFGKNITAKSSTDDELERFDPTKPFHPGPLKLEIKSIRNSTRTEDFAPVDMSALMENGEGRSLITAAVLLTWIAIWKWKAYISFFIVHTIDFIWTSIKNILGWGNERYETTITLGHEHPPYRHGLHGHHNHHHHKGQGHQHGPPAQHGHGWGGWGPPHKEKWVYKTKNPWHHPATKYFEQPTYQYLPGGKEYTLMGFDQHQAYKWRRKYGKKFYHYRRKYYRKRYRQKLKAQRQREKQKWKAERRKQKAARRKEKWERFKERVTDVQKFYNALKNGGSAEGDDDDDETNDDLKSSSEDGSKEKGTMEVKRKQDKAQDDLRKKLKITKTEDDAKDETDDELDDLKEHDENKKKGEDEDELADMKEDKEGKDDGDEEDDDDPEDDLPYADKTWQESSMEMEHGPPLHVHHSGHPHEYEPPYPPSYSPEQDYDPLPTKSKHQKHIRIRL